MPISLSFRDLTWDRQTETDDRCDDFCIRLLHLECASLNILQPATAIYLFNCTVNILLQEPTYIVADCSFIGVSLMEIQTINPCINPNKHMPQIQSKINTCNRSLQLFWAVKFYTCNHFATSLLRVCCKCSISNRQINLNMLHPHQRRQYTMRVYLLQILILISFIKQNLPNTINKSCKQVKTISINNWQWKFTIHQCKCNKHMTTINKITGK